MSKSLWRFVAIAPIKSWGIISETNRLISSISNKPPVKVSRTRFNVEPEEIKMTEEFQDATVVNSVVSEEPIVRSKASAKMPKFGNASILNQMEEIASKTNNTKSTRGRKRKTS